MLATLLPSSGRYMHSVRRERAHSKVTITHLTVWCIAKFKK